MARISIKTAEEIEGMRRACKVTAQILDAMDELVRPGISTEEIDRFVHKMTISLGAKPATLNYKGYTKSVCTSINDVVCHGVPSPYVTLKEGDIINIDVTSIVDGFFGDSSRMYFVGGEQACTPDAQELVKHAYQALYVGIAQVAPGRHIGDIGAAIQEYIKGTGKNYGIVREYTGHGIGRHFHELPQVVHAARWGSGDVMKAGMTFTIEPMINIGRSETVLSKVDGWTVRTADGSLSAQWEHTVLVTETGSEVLT
ncbi:MAG: type I methionyl aminopeptidase [Deltaproteobacteria bacterium]|nr:type I methionyl aminopeptidase [Deltaproteobacteria bacterium]